MKNTVLFTDSTCDMSVDLLEARGVVPVRLSYLMDDKEYFDDMNDESAQAFYARLRQGHMAKTSAINSERFVTLWTDILEQGKDVFYLAFSSALSATYSNACMARETLLEKYTDRKIYIVDSRCASLGEGLILNYIMDMADDGKSAEEVAAWAEENKLKLCHWFTVDDLHFLRRGGRVSGAAAMVGSILSVKPVLCVDDEGRLIMREKVRGRKKALKLLVDRMEETVVDAGNQTIFISHGDSLNDAQAVAQMVKERFNPKKIYINYVGPVIGSHSGPGTIALFYMGKNRENAD
ncbi:MAG: DegV family protein [Christensenellales bacterium]|jgi:DegV family protein with EDD domain